MAFDTRARPHPLPHLFFNLAIPSASLPLSFSPSAPSSASPPRIIAYNGPPAPLPPPLFPPLVLLQPACGTTMAMAPLPAAARHHHHGDGDVQPDPPRPPTAQCSRRHFYHLSPAPPDKPALSSSSSSTPPPAPRPCPVLSLKPPPLFHFWPDRPGLPAPLPRAISPSTLSVPHTKTSLSPFASHLHNPLPIFGHTTYPARASVLAPILPPFCLIQPEPPTPLTSLLPTPSLCEIHVEILSLTIPPTTAWPTLILRAPCSPTDCCFSLQLSTPDPTDGSPGRLMWKASRSFAGSYKNSPYAHKKGGSKNWRSSEILEFPQGLVSAVDFCKLILQFLACEISVVSWASFACVVVRAFVEHRLLGFGFSCSAVLGAFGEGPRPVSPSVASRGRHRLHHASFFSPEESGPDVKILLPRASGGLG